MVDTRDIPIERQEAYWDRWQESRSINAWALRRSRILLELVAGLRLDEARILDFGCGDGWFCPELAALGRVTGIDLSKANMDKARQRFPDIEFIGADLFEHPLPQRHFDVVVSQQVLAHVDDQPGYIERCARVLKDAGHLVLSTNNKLVMDRLGHEYVDDTGLGHLERWLSYRGLVELLEPRFVVLQSRSIIPRGQHGFLRLVNSTKLNGLLGRMVGPAALEAMKERLGLGYVNIVLARKR